jgi:hypothetical protein
MAETALEALVRLESQQTPAQKLLQELEAKSGTLDVEASPFELPPPDPLAVAEHIRLGLAPPTSQVSKEAEQLAAQGVDVLTGSPVGRLAAGFAQNEAQRANYLSTRLEEHFGWPIKVMTGPLGLEYIHPETNRRTLVDERGALSIGDVQELAGPALPVGGAIAGEVLGGPVAAGVGGAAGEAVRRGIGEYIGVRDEDFQAASRGVAGVGAFEGLASKGGEAVVKLAQQFKRFFRPQVIEPEMAERVLAEAQDAQAVADQISEITGRKFQPRTSQLSRDPNLLQADEVVRRSARFGPEIRATQKEHETTLETLFDIIHPQGDVSPTQVGRVVQGEARSQINPRVIAANEDVQTRIELLKRITEEIPRATNPQIRARLSAQAEQSLNIMKRGHEDVAWKEARRLYGYNVDTALSKIDVPIGRDLRRTLLQLMKESQESIGGDVAAGKRALVPKGLKEFSVDLHQMTVHLGSLKRRLRLQAKDEVITDPTGYDIGRVMGDIQAQRDAYLSRNYPEIYKQLKEAERLTAQRSDLFDKHIVGKLIRKQNGAYTLTDKTLVAEALGSGDKETIEHIIRAFDNHPAGRPTLQKSFMAFYRNEVVRDGVPDAVLHREFIANNTEVLDVLFPGNNVIRTLGEFEKQTALAVKRFEGFNKAVQKSFRGRIQNLAPERVVEDIFTKGFSNKEVSHLMNLAKSAGYGDQYIQAVGNQMKNRFVSPTSGVNLNALSKFVNTNNDRLSIIFGGRYTADMKLLLKGLSDIRTTGAGIQTTTKPTMLGALAEAMARVTVARPLSPAGVGLTRLKSTHALAAESVMNEIITDPKALRAVVLNRNKPLQNQAVGRILGILGGSALMDFENSAEILAPLTVEQELQP